MDGASEVSERAEERSYLPAGRDWPFTWRGWPCRRERPAMAAASASAAASAAAAAAAAADWPAADAPPPPTMSTLPWLREVTGRKMTFSH